MAMKFALAAAAIIMVTAGSAPAFAAKAGGQDMLAKCRAQAVQTTPGNPSAMQTRQRKQLVRLCMEKGGKL